MYGGAVASSPLGVEVQPDSGDSCRASSHGVGDSRRVSHGEDFRFLFAHFVRLSPFTAAVLLSLDSGSYAVIGSLRVPCVVYHDVLQTSWVSLTQPRFQRSRETHVTSAPSEIDECCGLLANIHQKPGSAFRRSHQEPLDTYFIQVGPFSANLRLVEHHATPEPG